MLLKRQRAPCFRTPFLYLMCFADDNVHALCRRRMQMGLVVGFILNIIFGLWRYLWGTF